MIVALLLLVLATLIAGPVGFVITAVLLLAFALVTGTLHLVIELLLLRSAPSARSPEADSIRRSGDLAGPGRYYPPALG